MLNRAAKRTPIFKLAGDYAAFESLLSEARAHVPVRIPAYCGMPNHWHLLLWPRADGDLSRFMKWLTETHTRRWHWDHLTVGHGAIYQGRFKSIPILDQEHLLRVWRYIERNPLRAGLVKRAEDWRWSSLWLRLHGGGGLDLDEGPLALPDQWTELVNEPQTEAELIAIRQLLRSKGHRLVLKTQNGV